MLYNILVIEKNAALLWEAAVSKQLLVLSSYNT